MRIFIMVMTIEEILSKIIQGLSQKSESPALDAQVLVAHCLEKSRSWVLAHPEAPLDNVQQNTIISALNRLEHGEPLPYVIGHWEFYGLDFLLTPEVLIPRPETELLVDHGLDWLRLHPQMRQAIDVGTGSGCIGISLAMNITDLHLLLTDISTPALDVARMNAEKYSLSARIKFRQADLLDGISGSWDLICANLPYIPTQVLQKLPVYGREPATALDGGHNGMALIRRLLEQARSRISPGGLMLLEIESSQGAEVNKLAQTLFPASEVHLHKDLSGQDRCVEIRHSNLIVHLCRRSEWLEAQKRGSFKSNSLNQEGYIHCSQPEQLLNVANRFYRGVSGLVVLWIDPERISSKIRWETADGELFPHIYGPIDLAAVISVKDFHPGTDGDCRLMQSPD
jgi:release factor glutamine methyltransferase